MQVVRIFFFFSQHIEDVLISGWSANTRIKCSTTTKTVSSDKILLFFLDWNWSQSENGTRGGEEAFLDMVSGGSKESGLKPQLKLKQWRRRLLKKRKKSGTSRGNGVRLIRPRSKTFSLLMNVETPHWRSPSLIMWLFLIFTQRCYFAEQMNHLPLHPYGSV